MASRMSAYFGIDVKYYPEKYTLTRLNENSCENVIIFDCTDNLKARQSIEEFGLHRTNRVIISCGNEEDFGQVLIGCDRNIRSEGELYTSYINIMTDIVSAILNPNKNNVLKINLLPTLLMLFKNFKDSEKPSCDQIQLQNDQSMPINSLVANLAFNAFYDIMSNVPLKYNMVTCNIHNTFDTKAITHPKAMFDLYAKALFDKYDSKFVLDNFCTIADLFKKNVYNYDITWIEDVITKYNRLAIPFLIMHIYKNYRLDGLRLEKIHKYISSLREGD